MAEKREKLKLKFGWQAFLLYRYFQLSPRMRLPEEFRTRTKKYASVVVRLYAKLPTRRKDVEVLGHQLLRSWTSVAAHTREASRARSDAEFCSKIEGALQEADESQLWIELLREDCGITGPEIDQLHNETNELIAILATIARRLKTEKLR